MKKKIIMMIMITLSSIILISCNQGSSANDQNQNDTSKVNNYSNSSQILEQAFKKSEGKEVTGNNFFNVTSDLIQKTYNSTYSRTNDEKNIYFDSYWNGSINRSDLSGNNIEEIYYVKDGFISYVNNYEDYIYFIHHNNVSYEIKRINKETLEVEVVVERQETYDADTSMGIVNDYLFYITTDENNNKSSLYRLDLKSDETTLVDTLNDCKINRFIIMDDNILFGNDVRNIDTFDVTNTIMHNEYFPYHNGCFFNLDDSDDKLTLQIWSDINKLYDDNAKVHLKLKTTDIKASDAYIVPLDSGIYLIHKERINSQNNEELHTIYEINESGDLTYIAEFNENNHVEMFIVNDKFATLLDDRNMLEVKIIN